MICSFLPPQGEELSLYLTLANSLQIAGKQRFHAIPDLLGCGLMIKL
jgi:hypothetical protein